MRQKSKLIEKDGINMLIDLLIKRSSIRNFRCQEISKEIIESILEAGRLSPSGGNEQPWVFGVITDRDMINSIAEIAYNQNWIKSAPLLIVLVTRLVEDERGGRDIQKSRFPHWEKQIENMDRNLYTCLNLEEHQTKIPGTHMVLQALEYGIGSTWISYFGVKMLGELLKLPDNHIPSEIIAFGYPEKEITPRKKKDLEEIVFYNKCN